MAANFNYWDLFGPELPEQWDEIYRISQWVKLFQDQVGLEQEEAKGLAEALVINAAQSEADTKVMDTVLHCLIETDKSMVDDVELAIAIHKFLWLMADTFYSRHAMNVPKLGIKPKEPRVYREILSQYLWVAYWIGVHTGAIDR